MPTLDEIRPVKKASEADLMELPGVTGISIGAKVVDGKKTGELSIIVYVEDKRDVPAKQRVPKEIQGVKTDVVQRRFKLNALVPVEQLRPAIDTTRYTQLRGGMSIGPCRSVFLEPPDVAVAGNYTVVGTLGAVVTDRGTGERMLLTNFHVAAVNDEWSAGDAMAQPGRPDGGACPADAIGELARAVVQGTTAGSGAGVDGAVIRLTGDRDSDCSIVGIGDVAGTADAADGMAVRKRGRTTELTFGTVTSTDLTVSVNFGDGIGTVTFENQVEIEADETQSATFGISGDSGSVVVNEADRVVGLYFAGNVEERDEDGNVIVPEGVIGIANPIAAVEAALNVRLCQSTFKKLEIKEGGKDFKDFGPKEVKEFGPKELKEFGPKELKEFGPKEFKEFGPKEFKELGPKELKERGPKEFKELGPKELKERGPKEFKEGKEPKEIFENKRLEGGPIGQEPFPGRPPGVGLPPGLEDRLRRLEITLGLTAASTPQPMAGFGCIDFAGMPQGAVPNPLMLQGASFLALDHAGAPWPNPGVKTFGAVTGLDAGFRMEIKLSTPCRAIRITLAHFSSPPTINILDATGNSIGSATLTPQQGTLQVITLPTGPVAGGGGVAAVIVSAPQNETLITEFCCLDELSKPGKFEKSEKPEKVEKIEKPEKAEKFEKPELKDKPEKFEKPELKDKPEKLEKPELKDKPEKLEKPELKDKPEKLEKPEHKELKDGPKESKEKPEHKELKDGPKEFKEDKDLEPKRIKEDKELGPKEFKEDKDLEPKRVKEDKELGPKEFKEDKELEPKRVKEDKELGPKEFKEDKDLEPKRIKEDKEPKEVFEGKPTDKPQENLPLPSGGMEERLTRIEAALGQRSGHFIDPSLRPDLSMGALRREPDGGSLGQKAAKDANDTKQTKDAKDTEKPSDG